MESNLAKLVINELETLFEPDTELNYGICPFLDDVYDDYYTDYDPFKYEEYVREIESIFLTWPKNSGVDGYPVPGVDGMSPDNTYYHENHKNKLVGEYGELRKDLIRHVILTLKEKYDV